MFPVKLIYDLTSRPTPRNDELDEEIDRLLYLKTAEEPNHLEPAKGRDANAALDSEVVTQWIRRRFEPALLLLLLGSDNYHKAKAELTKMERYKNFVDNLFRTIFLEKHSKRRIEGLCFDDLEQVNVSRATVKLKKTLTFLAEHLQHNSSDKLTLFGTDAYTQADIVLYSYLKRILVGKHIDSGLKSHVRLSEALIRFMQRYASKNTRVIDITSRDPSEDDTEENSLLADMTKPAVVAASIIMFYLWRNT